MLVANKFSNEGIPILLGDPLPFSSVLLLPDVLPLVGCMVVCMVDSSSEVVDSVASGIELAVVAICVLSST